MSTETAPQRTGSVLGRAARWAGAFVSPQGIDSYLQPVIPTWSAEGVRARIVGVERATPDAVTLTLRPNRNWPGFRAGQHTELSVEIDGVRHTRCYSMANAEGRTDTIELTIKAHPGGTVSPWLVAHAAVGDVVELSPPRGEFTLPVDLPARLLLISGGSGITPVLSMARTLCAAGEAGRVTFLHYALTPEGQLYRDELTALEAAYPALRVVRVFTDVPGAGDLDGFLDAAQLDAAEPGWRHAAAFVCGPTPLMDAARAVYETDGRSELLHTEAFTLPQFLAEAGSAGGTLRFAKSGAEVASDGRPVLLQAEAAGLAPASGCRMGICHTCVRTLQCGTVRNVVTGELTDEPGSTVRVCVSVPVGDVAIDL